MRRPLAFLAGPAAMAVALLLPEPAGMSEAAWLVAALLAWMAVWWTTEAVPIPATALLPIPVLPALGVLDVRDAAAPYADPLIFLFLGGFLIAAGLQRWGLHRRTALAIVRVVGARPHMQVAGFMAATAFLSMWVSNTATTIMMLPIALSVVSLERDSLGEHGDAFAKALLLGLAFSASVGGIGTLIGTPPNALLAAFLGRTYGIALGFGEWMAVGVPVALSLLAVIWVWLTRVVYRLPRTELPHAADLTRTMLRDMGPPTRAEITVGAVFAAAALLWITRPLLPDGLTDPGIAVVAGLALFALPVDGKGTRALDWETAKSIPWGVLLLFGGGLSLAGAIEASGLAAATGGALAGLGHYPDLVVVAAAVTLIVFLTSVATNTAVTAAFLPVLGALAADMGIAPMALLVPAAMAASCAFILPVGTPPNAIVFASGAVSVRDMFRAGIGLNLIAIMLVTLAGYGLALALLT